MSIMGSPPGPETILDGKPYLYFAGTAYLGLQADPRVIEAGCAAMRKYGVHSATSRKGFGENPATLEVERLAARYFGTEDAFYFATGFAGPTILTQEQTTYDLIVMDEHAHYASMNAADLAAAWSSGVIERFRHGDADDLRRVLAKHEPRSPRVLVMCDGISPVLGDIAPVADYQRVIDAFDAGPAMLAVDDAHGVGVLGSHGRGVVELASERSGLPIGVNSSGVHVRSSVALCATLSKALGGYGGIIPGSAARIAELKASSPWFNGASAPPAAAAGASAEALRIILTDPAIRSRLEGNVKHLRDRLRALGLPVADTPVPIIPLQFGDAANMRRIQESLKDRGIIIAYIQRYSGVGPEGCLRIAVFATHTPAMIDRLADELARSI